MRATSLFYSAACRRLLCGRKNLGANQHALTKEKGCDIGYAPAIGSCERSYSVDTCTVAALDVITAFAVPNPNGPSRRICFHNVQRNLPVLTAGSCTTFTTAALTGFAPGTGDTIALGLPKSLVSSLGNGIFLLYQAWETTTNASPTLTLQVCNPAVSRYGGGATGTIRIDVFKH